MRLLGPPRITVATDIPAPPEQVWADVRRIESHVEWMEDAERITFTTSGHEGPGTAFDCATKVGPIRLRDRMVITEWADAAVMGIRHVGLVTGTGRFTLEPIGTASTRFTWQEELTFPWWLGGVLGAHAGSLVLRVVWRRNLRNLRARFA